LTETLLGFSLGSDSKAQPSSINEFFNQLAADFLCSCSRFGLFELPSVYVGWSPDTAAEGRVRKLDDGYLVTINAGLTLLHSHIGRLLMSRGPLTVEVGERLYKNVIKPDHEDWQVGREIGLTLLGFAIGDLSRITPVANEYSIRGIASIMPPIAANKFIIAHEICHILLGHVGNNDVNKLDRFRDFLFSPPLPKDWEEEVHADLYAFKILVGHSSTDSWVGAVGALLAIYIDYALWALTGAPLFRKYFEWDSGGSLPDLTTAAAIPTRTYPPPKVRLGILMKEAENSLDQQVYKIILSYQELFEEGINWSLAYVDFLAGKIMEKVAAGG